MVGLRILLEASFHQKTNNNKSKPQVIYKTKTISIKPITTALPPSPSPSQPCSSSSTFFYPSSPLPPINFLDACFLCRKRLLPSKDIFMYKGDRAFCSVDCRYTHILMDEEIVKKKKHHPVVEMKPTTTPTAVASAPRYQRKHHHHRVVCRGGCA